jgi:hypothetical protein
MRLQIILLERFSDLLTHAAPVVKAISNHARRRQAWLRKQLLDVVL